MLTSLIFTLYVLQNVRGFTTMTFLLRISLLGCNAVLTGCALTHNSYVETVTHILNKIYNTLFLMNIIYFTFWFLMLCNFFWRSTDQKWPENRNSTFLACINKKWNVEIDSPTLCGGQGKRMWKFLLESAWGSTISFKH